MFSEAAEHEAEALPAKLRPADYKDPGMYAMMLDQPKALAYQQEVVRDLEQKRPAVIVWVRSPLSWLARPSSPRLIMQYLNKLMKARYVLVGGSLRRDAAAEWQEPLKKENDGICSIKVYKLIRK